MRSLVQKLINHAPQYHLFQAMRLLETDFDEKMRYRLTSAPTLGFPSADLKSVRVDANGTLILESTYFGLYGVDGPLPAYLLQAAAQDDEKGELFRAFLDIFNNRFYQLLFEAWKRGRSALFLKNKSSRYRQHLSSIAQQVSGSVSSQKPYPYVGLLGARVHSAEALRGLLQDHLKITVQVLQFVPVWMPISAVSPLGVNSVLGDNMLIGNRVLDFSQKICIQIGPLKYKKARKLFPDTKEYQSFCHLINEYIGGFVQFRLCLKVFFYNSYMQSLGETGMQLGYSTWLGERDPKRPCVFLFNGENHKCH